MSPRAKGGKRGDESTLALLVCPNPDRLAFDCFGAVNLSVCERMGKDKSIRRLYYNGPQKGVGRQEKYRDEFLG